MIAPTSNVITQGQHLASKSVDHSYLPDPTIYAPEDGVIDSYQQRGSGTSDAGNCLRMTGATGLHQFAHCQSSYVKPGQRVKQGQALAVMGDTGYAFGRHLHYWILTPSGYVYPPNLYKGKPQGVDMANRSQVNNLYKAILHRDGDKGGLDNYQGRDANSIVADFLGSDEFKRHQAYISTVQKQIADLQTALANEKKKAPKVVVKEVEKIVERIVEIEKEVKVEVEPSWIVKVRDFINKFLNKV